MFETISQRWPAAIAGLVFPPKSYAITHPSDTFLVSATALKLRSQSGKHRSVIRYAGLTASLSCEQDRRALELEQFARELLTRSEQIEDGPLEWLHHWLGEDRPDSARAEGPVEVQ